MKLLLRFALTLQFLMSCNSGGGGDDTPQAELGVDTPKVELLQINSNEDEPVEIELPSSSGMNDCTLESLNSLEVESPCACTSASCSVSVKPIANYYGLSSFEYILTNQQGSARSKVEIAVAPIEDELELVERFHFANQGIERFITLDYNDPDGELAQSCFVEDQNNITVTQACTCTEGVCEVGIISNTEGDASFTYRIDDSVKQARSMIIRSPNPFITDWDLDSNDTKITFNLPTYVSLPESPLVTPEYEATIFWGDGGHTNIFGAQSISHTYATAGQYQVMITGTLNAFSVSGTSKRFLTQVSNLGDLEWKSFYGMLSDCPNLGLVQGGQTQEVQTMARMFFNSPNAIPQTSGWDTSKVKDFSFSFRSATAANPDTSNWDTSNVITMQGMFEGASSAQPDTSAWNTANVKNMLWLFNFASSASPDVSNWDTSKVEKMGLMFRSATMANPDTSSWDVGSVTDFENMFWLSGIDSTNYGIFLEGAAETANQANVFLGQVGSNEFPVAYHIDSAGDHSFLTDERGWIMLDGGVL